MFRRDSKNDENFQRQIANLRAQLGGAEGDDYEIEIEQNTPAWSASDAMANSYNSYSNDRNRYTYQEQQPIRSDLAVPQPMGVAIPQVDMSSTVIAQSAQWVGELDTADPIHIHGHFKGVVQSRSEVFVGDEADVDAKVNAAVLIVAGLVKGSVACTTRLEVLPTGRITADVSTPSLVVHQGAMVSGNVRMSGDKAAAQSGPALMRKS